jgi:hypothetical protein
MKKIETYKKEIERIKKEKGKLTAKILLQEAEDKNNPLHSYFEWDDKEGAHQWRLHKARCLINVITFSLKTNKNDKEVYAYELIKTNSHKEYKHVCEILSNKMWKEQITNQAVREISYWRQKYEIYAEFSPIVKEIKRIERRFKINGTKKGTSKDDGSKTTRKSRAKGKG